MPHRRAILIAGGRHPFEVSALFAATCAGSAAALSPSVRPPTMTSTMGEPLLVAWLALLSLGGLVGLVGGHWHGDVVTGLLVEASGVLAVATMCTLYVVALVAVTPSTALVAGGLLAGFAGGAWGRFAQIAGELRRIRRGVIAGVTVDLPVLVEPVDCDQAPDDPDCRGTE